MKTGAHLRQLGARGRITAVSSWLGPRERFEIHLDLPANCASGSPELAVTSETPSIAWPAISCARFLRSSGPSVASSSIAEGGVPQAANAGLACGCAETRLTAALQASNLLDNHAGSYGAPVVWPPSAAVRLAFCGHPRLAKADTPFDEDSETFHPFPIEHVARPDRRLLRVGRAAPV